MDEQDAERLRFGDCCGGSRGSSDRGVSEDSGVGSCGFLGSRGDCVECVGRGDCVLRTVVWGYSRLFVTYI